MDDYFLYKDFEIEADLKTVNFNFSIYKNNQTYDLRETMVFPVELNKAGPIMSSLRALHLATGISYYKIFVSKRIEHPYKMDEAESNFWNEVFLSGLGEFLYVNNLSKDSIAKFNPKDGAEFIDEISWQPVTSAMLGIGGGKDSIVAGELLKQAGVPLQGFVMATGEQLGQTQSVATTMDIGLSPVQRTIDKQLIELQALPGAHSGHIPVSLIYGLVGATLAIANNYKYVVVANESSASIPRVSWQGMDINHQWSKSFDFEILLQNYLHRFVSEKLTYFSAIRPLGSIHIASIFANFSQYYTIFTSDNSVFRIDPSKRPNGRWSLESPKSLSSFILLAPWLSETELLETFGRDFLNEQSLEQLFYSLLEIEGHQPLDCVGTAEELLISLNLAVKQGKFINSFLALKAKERGVLTDDNWENKLSEHLTLSPQHAIPFEILAKIYPDLANLNPLLALKNKEVVFVGAGKRRAMQGVKSFLEENVDLASFKSVEKSEGDKPLDFLKKLDQEKTVFIKNEGIPGKEMPVPYITPMQLFFELVRQTGAKVIGITGSKGKSTTSALTAHILKSAGKDAILAGNIGISPLLSLNNATEDTIFVLELSSYQLSDLKRSPHISACLNLYNDHTDWHGTLENYFESKRNIMRYAGSDDIFIYNPDFEELKKWAAEGACESVAISPDEKLDLSGANLFGEHNKLNALFAKQIALQIGIDEEVINKAIKSFQPLDHRMEVVATKNGRTYIDDAIGMTPESTIASLKAVSSKYGQIGCLMLGGQDRNYDFTELMNTVAQLNIQKLVLFPDTISKIKLHFPSGYTPDYIEAENMQAAVTFASQQSPENSVVLLSTAAPSYSLWEDYEDKGNQFKEAVNALP